MPNGAYIHLLINHVPVILAPLGLAAVLLALIMNRRCIWIYGVATITLAGLSAYPVMLTGHSAEHVVKQRIPGVSRSAINEHEESGEAATWTLLAAGAIAAFAWWRLSRSAGELALWLRALVVLGAIAGAGMATYASYEGGYIIHTEAH